MANNDGVVCRCCQAAMQSSAQSSSLLLLSATATRPLFEACQRRQLTQKEATAIDGSFGVFGKEAAASGFAEGG